MTHLLVRGPRHILFVFTLVLEILVMVNWQLSKMSICWPVSHDCITGWVIQLTEVTHFLKLSADQFLVFNWSRAQVLFFRGGMGHFIVMDGSKAGVDLVLIQNFLLYYVNQVFLVLTSINFFKGNFHNKSQEKEVCIKTRSPSASHSLEG